MHAVLSPRARGPTIQPSLDLPAAAGSGQESHFGLLRGGEDRPEAAPARTPGHLLCQGMGHTRDRSGAVWIGFWDIYFFLSLIIFSFDPPRPIPGPCCSALGSEPQCSITAAGGPQRAAPPLPP